MCRGTAKREKDSSPFHSGSAVLNLTLFHLSRPRGSLRPENIREPFIHLSGSVNGKLMTESYSDVRTETRTGLRFTSISRNIRHPVLRKYDAASIRTFQRYYDQYVTENSERAAQYGDADGTRTSRPVQLKLCEDSKCVSSICH